MALKNRKVVLRRHFSTARNNIKRNKKRFFLPVLSIFLTLTFVSFLFSGILNVGASVYKMTKDTQVTILLDDGVGKKIEPSLARVKGVQKLEYLSKDDQLNQLSDLLSKDWQGFKGDGNPLKDSYVATVSDKASIDNLEKRLEQVKGVQLATDNRADNDAVAKNTTIITVILVVVALATLVFSSTSIASVIELSLSSRGKEIEIMRLLGATKKFVRLPFEIEGCYIGFYGALPSVVLNVALYTWIYSSFGRVLSEQGFDLLNPFMNGVLIAVFVMLLGVIVGGLSAKLRSNKLLEF